MLLTCFAQQTHKTHHFVIAEPPLIRKTVECMHQKSRKAVQHATVSYRTLMVYQVCDHVGRGVRMGIVRRVDLEWKVNGDY